MLRHSKHVGKGLCATLSFDKLRTGLYLRGTPFLLTQDFYGVCPASKNSTAIRIATPFST